MNLQDSTARANIAKFKIEREKDARIAALEARAAAPGVSFVEADIASFEPSEALDLVFSNAALHWLPDHSALFPRLCSWLAPGGCLAVQMPASFHLPSHTAAHEAAADGPWRDFVPPGTERADVHPLDDYFGWLSPRVRKLDLWETTYLHILEGDDPVTEWFKSTLLVPFMEALPQEHRDGFLEAYRRRVKAAYPKSEDGRTLMPMRRIFIVAEERCFRSRPCGDAGLCGDGRLDGRLSGRALAGHRQSAGAHRYPRRLRRRGAGLVPARKVG